MTTEEKAEFTDALTEKFVLIPKNKFYYIIGGAVAVIVVATGLSLASVFAYLRSEPAEIARKRIEQIRGQAEVHLKRLEDEGSYAIRLATLMVRDGVVISGSKDVHYVAATGV